ncbi:MAG: hypothetical protein GXX96_38960 [Planctomycetaceae bacterium]|nr:hypothetical protein [Planctomycetaceae bacterium]
MLTDIERRRERRIVLSAVTGTFALANLLVPSVFENMSPSYHMVGIAYFCAGGLIAEVCVLAIWGAMGGSPLKYRIPVTLGLVLLAACTLVVGFRILDDGFPLSVAVLVIGLSFGMYVCLLAPLGIVRRVTKRRIAVPNEVRASAQDRPETQFGLRYLLAGPVVVSGIFILLRYSLPQDDSMVGPSLAEILGMLFGVAVFITFSAMICIPCIWLTLADRRRAGAAVLLAVVVLAGPWIALTVLEMGYGPIGPDVWEAMLVTSSFGAGVSATTLLLLYVWRQLGYRLVGPRSGNPFVDKGCDEQVDPDGSRRNENS